MLDINLYLIAGQIITFLAGLVILWRIAYKPITGIFKQRADKIKADLDAAEKARRDVEGMKLDYEAQMNRLAAEAQKMMNQAVKDAQSVRDEIVNGAKDQGQAILARATEQIGFEKEKAIRELRRQVLEVSLLVAEKAIGRWSWFPGPGDANLLGIPVYNFTGWIFICGFAAALFLLALTGLLAFRSIRLYVALNEEQQSLHRMVEVRALAGEIEEEERESLRGHARQASSAGRQAVFSIVLGCSLALFFLAGAGLIVRHGAAPEQLVRLATALHVQAVFAAHSRFRIV